jgi:hypothetical protein
MELYLLKYDNEGQYFERDMKAAGVHIVDPRLMKKFPGIVTGYATKFNAERYLAVFGHKPIKIS